MQRVTIDKVDGGYVVEHIDTDAPEGERHHTFKEARVDRAFDKARKTLVPPVKRKRK